MVSSWALTAPPALPSSSLTTCSWATRFTCAHRSANCGLASRLPTCVRVKLSTPLVRGTASPGSKRGHPGRHVWLGGQRLEGVCGDCLDVEVLDDGQRDLVGQRLLHRGVVRQGGDGLDVLLRVGELRARPDRRHRQRRQDARQDEQDRGGDPPPRGSSGALRGGGLRGSRGLGQAPLELRHPGSEAFDLVDLAHDAQLQSPVDRLPRPSVTARVTTSPARGEFGFCVSARLSGQAPGQDRVAPNQAA